jgi:glycosyltransferase involved in cell wall biosynthesis
MRVLHLYKDYAPVFGGIENHIRVLAQGLRGAGVDAQVLVTNTGSQTTRETIAGVPVTKTGRQANLSSAPLSLGFLSEVWKQEKGMDIAHAHAPYPPGELAHLFLGRANRFVITYHSDIVKQRVLGTFYAPFLRAVLRKADLIAVATPVHVPTSPFLQPLAEKCRVIPYGQDLHRFAPTLVRLEAAAQMRTRYGGGPLLLFVGRLRHYKGVDVLIQAMRDVPDAQALIAGIGPEEIACRTLTQEMGLGDRVHFLGEPSDDELVTIYRAADIFVLPSTNRAEMFGIVQIEAMASGLPVICTELGTGTSFVNQHGLTGLVVPPNDPTALAGAINQLVTNPELARRMGEGGKARAAAEFSVQVMVQRTLDFYREALERRP